MELVVRLDEQAMALADTVGGHQRLLEVFMARARVKTSTRVQINISTTRQRNSWVSAILLKSTAGDCWQFEIKVGRSGDGLHSLAHELGHVASYLETRRRIKSHEVWLFEVLAWAWAEDFLGQLGRSLDYEYALDCLRTYIRAGDFDEAIRTLYESPAKLSPTERQALNWIASIGGDKMLARRRRSLQRREWIRGWLEAATARER